ncbi:MAG: glycosyltransferase, partial [gamma proteobacterium symbiont of Bathyaustriella thionipta]|nr:glycosyltransferase [gamma proteobacterium symbiont of Bathyaustriella thionipta]MCU7951546.1 glycosyltransferase [gamma proteobacterium symbiont of Bathyaustriella thionipta]MCU7958136.1 glycosyltransferase [gamma proteobacterium symbiont of Bathyaustriella thionipta]
HRHVGFNKLHNFSVKLFFSIFFKFMLNSYISIIIKALNEEDCIARAIESALKCIENYSGEVILADSLSGDATISIARQYPVKIVQINNASERRCGIGPQLGYQYAQGEFVYILDADMVLDKQFIDAALTYLKENTQVGGVAGIIEEMSHANYQFKQRKNKLDQPKNIESVDSLDMGGLYRSAAIEDVGFFSDINLHAFEEADLGYRLKAKGV